MLNRSKLSGLRLDELTDEHAQQFAAEYCKLSPSGINRGLRTLRRALNLAYQWNQLDKPVKVELAKGENQRDRVLTESELTAYLDACPQPWRDVASVIAEEGMRPGEVFALRWSHILMGDGWLDHQGC
jgi:integrase